MQMLEAVKRYPGLTTYAVCILCFRLHDLWVYPEMTEAQSFWRRWPLYLGSVLFFGAYMAWWEHRVNAAQED